MAWMKNELLSQVWNLVAKEDIIPIVLPWKILLQCHSTLKVWNNIFREIELDMTQKSNLTEIAGM